MEQLLSIGQGTTLKATIYLFKNDNNKRKSLRLCIWSQREQGSDARIVSMTLFILSLCTISGHTADFKPNVLLEL